MIQTQLKSASTAGAGPNKPRTACQAQSQHKCFTCALLCSIYKVVNGNVQQVAGPGAHLSRWATMKRGRSATAPGGGGRGVSRLGPHPGPAQLT